MTDFWTRKPSKNPGLGPPNTTRIAEKMARSTMRQMPHDYPAVFRERHDLGSAEQMHGVFAPTTLCFTAEQPNCFYADEGGVPFRGQDSAKEWLDLKIKAMDTNSRIKILVTGPAGTGKTTLMWIVAHRIMQERMKRGIPLEDQRFFELLPNQFQKKTDFDPFVRQLQPWDIVFVDEVHVLKDAIGAEPLFHTLADTGKPRYPLGQGEGWLDVPPTVCWLTATTDPGRMDDTTGGALRRRLEPEIRLEDPSVETLVSILHDQAMPIHPDAAFDLAYRSGGLPWQALLVYQQARDVAVVDGSSMIYPSHGKRACEIMGLDEKGLSREDRAVIKVLLQTPYTMVTNGEVRYRMAESALCAASGVDPKTYGSRVKPKLMRNGYLTTTGGQCLTQKALDDYFYLKEE
jgi:holliday junction DNA helicase RuvB